MPHVRSGKLKAIGVSTAKLSSQLPDVPTLKEQGLADLDAGAWNGIVAPAGTPAPLLERIRREIVAVLKEPEVVAVLNNQLMEVIGSTAEEFAAHLREERDRWTPVIVKSRITLD